MSERKQRATSATASGTASACACATSTAELAVARVQMAACLLAGAASLLLKFYLAGLAGPKGLAHLGGHRCQDACSLGV